MRQFSKPIALSLMFLMGATVAASAAPWSQTAVVVPYAASTVGNPATTASHPASWSYDPYTHGATPCPQGDSDGGPKCTVLIPPSNPS